MTKPGTQPRSEPYAEPHVVTDPAAADFLASPNTRSLLGPFLQGETSLSDAAAALGGMKLSTLHRRVRQMVTLGLLEETRTETRGGHRVRLYRATHREFVVPLERTSSVDLESFVTAGLQNASNRLARGTAKEMRRCSPDWGLRIFDSGGADAFQQVVALGENGDYRGLERRDFYGDCGVRLDPDTARAFRAELHALYEKYLELPASKVEGDGYFLTVGFTPL